MKLRDYQQRSIDELYAWFNAGHEGNPCMVLPTGSGKSHIVAALCKDALQQWPETKVLMLTHVKELISQNAEKMREHWQNAPLGIYSSSLKKKQLGEPITFAGIQSVRDKAHQLGHIDLVIIDECHLVSHKNEGGYRNLLSDLSVINPRLRVIGLTATPYRLNHGLITDKPALFDDMLMPVTIEYLISKGFLCTLKSKMTKTKLDTSEVHKRGGEFIESELQAAVDTDDKNKDVVSEVIRLAGDRKAWLFFCAGIDHAEHVKDMLISKGITAECVTGKTPQAQRDRIIADYKAGKIRALTNANVLTTGFDYPDIDLIAMLRPTMSCSLYVQMAGRGMRPKSHTDHCLVLDFAGVVETHGPITNVKPPNKKEPGKEGEAPVKVCDECAELVAISAKVCPACGHRFPEPEEADLNSILKLRNDDIMGIEGSEMEVTSWNWRKHTSKASGKEMLAVTYYGALSDAPVTEYFCVDHEGYAGDKAKSLFNKICANSNVNAVYSGNVDLDRVAAYMQKKSTPPSLIEYTKDGKFYRVINRSWDV
jgi:DNA repair protein RadD